MTHILHILVEGHTEEGFVKQVLKPHLQSLGIIVKPYILVTNIKKDKRGGLINYTQVQNNLRRIAQSIKPNANEIHYQTTMFDFYALPNDFPAYEEAMSIHDAYLRIEKLEQAFKQDVTHIRHFIPYIQLHEFEALVFCGLDYLANDYDGCEDEIENLKKVLVSYHNNPEAIDNHASTAPSKRLIAAFKDKNKYNYNKTLSGIAVTKAVSLPNLRKQCRHFDAWVTQLENIMRA